MSAPTINATAVRDMHATLARLRIARAVSDAAEIRVAERRLNWLLDNHVPRKDSQ